ncbi:uncharacterized protein LOC123204699 [Mangifera indica]|uniref:uncharacterized protein LOC123204699 n=1 Tax=Mangifera indica TaxID=29780 RepID=UPI001CFBB568|nr:uncharacterized protein LOC123204699 [Mangifera indica]
MSRVSSEHSECSASPKRLSATFLISISSLISLCAKQASRVTSKLKAKSKPVSKKFYQERSYNTSLSVPPSPMSPLRARPKQLITTISNKAIKFMNKKKVGEEKEDDAIFHASREEDFGDGGVWQRAILMGDKCQPLDFSGVIYYDSRGKRLSEVPLRSPRASPLPGYLARRQET